ncbi:MAG TPA: oligosaccharide flippase family protein [Bacteroidia bacterium]|nr:oligosaccharide flippase family protein [Bacteroidia bacterium]
MSSLKDILKNSSVYTILGFLPTASRIFLLPIFLIYLSPEDFALIGLNTLVAGLLPLVMTLGLENAFVRFYFDYSRKPKLLRAYLSTILLFVMFSSTIISVLIFPFGEAIFKLIFKTKEFSFIPFGITALLSAFFASIYTIIFALYRNKQDIKSYTYFAGGMFLATTIAESLAIIVFKCGPIGVIWTKLIATGIITLFFLFKVFRENGLFFEKRFIKPSYKYALPLIPYVLFGLVFTSFDRIMIEHNFDLTSLAVYNLAMAIAHITDSFMYALQSATYPTVYSLLKENMDKNTNKISQIYRLIGLVVLLIISALIASTPIGIINFLNPKYIPAIALIPIVLISYGFRYLHIVFTEPLFFFKQTKKLPWLALIGGSVSIIGNLTLLPLFGLTGAAFTFVIAKLIQLCPTYYWYLKASSLRFKLNYIYPIMFIIFAISLLLSFSFNNLILTPWILYTLSFMPFISIFSCVYIVFWVNSNYKFIIPTLDNFKKYF